MRRNVYVIICNWKLFEIGFEEKTFEGLENKKKSHSKVEKLEHNALRIQMYLQPNKIQISKEETQLIFKLCCRVTEAKVNLKGKYDNLDCRACGQQEENQEHILKCEELNKNNKTDEINYKHLFDGSVTEKLKIAKLFKENIKF